jgi:hypothetical protein
MGACESKFVEPGEIQRSPYLNAKCTMAATAPTKRKFELNSAELAALHGVKSARMASGIPYVIRGLVELRISGSARRRGQQPAAITAFHFGQTNVTQVFPGSSSVCCCKRWDLSNTGFRDDNNQ